MRQLFNIRLIAAVAALAGLVLFVNTVVADDDPIDAIIEQTTPDRRIDLIAPVVASTSSPGFGIGRDGVTVGFLDLILPEGQVMRIAPGTEGELGCEGLDGLNECAVFADLLGDAVVWFAILPQAERATVELPPIIDLENGYALFDNGWQIRYPPVIERDCGNEDIPTFSDFLRRFGPDSVSIIDLEVQQVVVVRCGAEVVASTTVPVTTLGGLPAFDPDVPDQAP